MMGKIDELIARAYGCTDIKAWAEDALAELLRLQARDRRLEELEAEWSTRRVPSARCARQLRAARGGT